MKNSPWTCPFCGCKDMETNDTQEGRFYIICEACGHVDGWTVGETKFGVNPPELLCLNTMIGILISESLWKKGTIEKQDVLTAAEDAIEKATKLLEGKE